LLALLCVPGVALAAKYASIVIEADSGKVLQETSADARIYPASLTKMMTLYLLFERLDSGELTLKSKLRVSKRAAKQPATNLSLKAGANITVDLAIRALIVRSANDVATVVAEAIGGTESEFARLMTKKARKLGMKTTVFKNASGLPHGSQVSTARELAMLSLALVQHFPHYYHYFSVGKFAYNGRTYYGHNRLMARYAGADGLKTGYIRASGYNLATSAVRDGRRLIGVVVGGKSAGSRDRQMAALLDRGFGIAPGKEAPAIMVAEAKPASKTSGKKGSSAIALMLPPVKPPLSLSATQVATLVQSVPVPAKAPDKAVAKAAARTIVLAMPILVKPSHGDAATATAVAEISPAAGAAAQPQPIQVALAAEAAVAPAALSDAATDIDPLAAVLEATIGIKSAAAAEPVVETAALEPATPAPAPLGRSAPSAWTVQVGAFSRFAAANAAVTEASRAVPKLLGSAQYRIEEAAKGDQTIYRAQFVGLEEDAAKSACKNLKAQDLACIVLSPKVAIAEVAN
jgi:D-alanyl-D-alanine carboxypeptidase